MTEREREKGKCYKRVTQQRCKQFPKRNQTFKVQKKTNVWLHSYLRQSVRWRETDHANKDIFCLVLRKRVRRRRERKRKKERKEITRFIHLNSLKGCVGLNPRYIGTVQKRVNRVGLIHQWIVLRILNRSILKINIGPSWGQPDRRQAELLSGCVQRGKPALSSALPGRPRTCQRLGKAIACIQISTAGSWWLWTTAEALLFFRFSHQTHCWKELVSN